MNMAEYTIYIRDKSRKRIAQVEHYARLDLRLRFNKVGKWVLEMEAGTLAANLLTWGGGIVVVRDGMEILSGPVRQMDRKWDRNQNVLIASGPDDLTYLEDLLAYPVPGGPPYTSQAYDVRSGAAETVMKAYVDFNAGPNANSQRRINGLTIETDSAIGGSVTGRARFSKLLELMQSLAIQGGGLGFRIVDLEFQVYQPGDLTGSIVLSPDLGNLEAFSYRAKAAKGNYVICGGSGEGTARTFAEKGDSASIVRYGDRIELFRDRRDTTDTAELNAQIDEELAKRAENTTLAITPIDIENMAFFQDYNLGDRVTVQVDGEEIQDVIREAQIKVIGGMESVKPVVSSKGAQVSEPLAALFEQSRDLEQRISNLERV